MPRHNPFTVKIESVRGCTRRCPFCALSTIEWKDEPWKFMEMKLFRRVVEDLAEWLPKHSMEFAERGEPTMHPRFMEMLMYARKHLPKVQLTVITNGDRLMVKHQDAIDWVGEAFANGLNFLMIDCYDADRHQVMKDLFPKASDFFEDNRHPYRYHTPKHQEIILVNAAPGMSNTIRWYQNQGGNVDVAQAREHGFEIPEVGEPLPTMCVRPFRELVLHYDGTVPICCNDWSEEAIAGKFPGTGLEQIWKSSLDAYRKDLLEKNRAAIVPCAKCSERAGFRVGLEMSWFREGKA